MVEDLAIALDKTAFSMLSGRTGNAQPRPPEVSLQVVGTTLTVILNGRGVLALGRSASQAKSLLIGVGTKMVYCQPPVI